MSFELAAFNDPVLDATYLEYLLEQEAPDAAVHFGRLWDYFRNPLSPAFGVAADALNASSRPYFQAQEAGLPARLTGLAPAGVAAAGGLQRKEIVIENDIAWRVQTMVDFLFGKPLSIRSLAADAGTAATVEGVVKALFDANGGQRFFQELALLGAVYGFVDVVLRPAEEFFARCRPLSASPAPTPSSPPAGDADPSAPRPVPSGGAAARPAQDPGSARSNPIPARVEQLARLLSLETIEAARVLPFCDPCDVRALRGWCQTYRRPGTELAAPGGAARFGWAGRRDLACRSVEVVEVLGPRWWQRYDDRRLVAEGPNVLGRLPVVHIQNLPLPASYEGLSDVEGLLALQDELNTRLSDRASRVTYQSFKMYLSKGVEGFLERPVGPGQMWATHNLDASIQEFGHDAGSPSESEHIAQVRAAMDKVSGVTPLAAGLLAGNVGHLTSATALRVVLSGLLARTARKRLTYGAGIAAIVELALGLLDRAGALPTSAEDRRVEIHWPNPLPDDERERLAAAEAKAALGVPRQRVLAELGYDDDSLVGWD